MDTNPTDMALTRDAEIKQERESSAESDTPFSAIRRLMNNTQPESNQPSAHTIIAESKYTTEPVELHPELKAILETWHEKEGKAIPPCKYHYYSPRYRNGMRPWKAFDREGREVDLTHFSIKAPVSYSVIAARFPDNSLKFVCSYLKNSSKYGSFLQAWLGWDGGFEPEPCIIRHWGEPGEVIEYQPEAWTSIDEQRQGEQQGTQRGAQNAARPSPGSVTRKRAAASVSTGMSHNKRRQQEVRDKTSAGSEGSDSSMESTSDDESSECSHEDTLENDINTRVSRLRPQRGSAIDRPPPVSANNRPRPNIVNNRLLPVPGQEPEVLFKLSFFKFTVQHVRDFPLEECKTSKALFVKASAFYRIFDRNIKVEVLSCQLASRSEQHYIFAGSEGEFSLLVRQAQEVARSTGKPLTIEVGLVQS
ncbi:hypothetical protein BDW75DRAFT_204995 [Aspergillus navahoensis]